MESFDESYLHTGYEPKNYDLMETYVETLTEFLTPPQFSEQRFLEDVEYDDTALEEMPHEVHRVHVHHSQQEKACLPVSRRRHCPKEQGDPSMKEQGDLFGPTEGANPRRMTGGD